MRILLGILLLVNGVSFAGELVFRPRLEPAGTGGRLFRRAVPDRPRVGVVLSGGGARGIAHIGALAALEDAGIPIDMIVGTSIGAAIGGLYAAGYTPDELEAMGKDVEWGGLFSNAPARASLFATSGHQSDHFAELTLKDWRPVLPTGYSGGQKLTTLLTDLFIRARFRPENSFDDLKIPFRAVSTDLATGNMVVHERGSLSEVVRASMSVPLFFTPMVMDSMLLVDGGLVNCIPVDVARAMGADIVIAIDLAGLLRSRSSLDAPVAIADQVMSIMMKVPNRLQREQADIVVQPPVGEYLPADFSSYSRLVAIGRESMAALVDSVKRRLAATEPVAAGDSVRLTAVTVNGAEGAEAAVLAAAGLALPGRFAVTELQRAVDRVYAIGDVDSVELRVSGTDSTGRVAAIGIKRRPLVERVRVSGGTLFGQDALTAPFGTMVGTRLNTRTCETAVSVLCSRYRRAGYALARVTGVENRDGTLTVTLDEGRVSRITIRGNDRTAAYVIRRAFPVRDGDLFNVERVTRGIRNLYGTGLFATVNCAVEPEGDAFRLAVRVREKPYTGLRLGLRFCLAEGSAAFTELRNGNLLGGGINGSVRVQYGERRREVIMSAGSDRVGASYFSGNVVLTYRYRDWRYHDHAHVRQDAVQEYWEGIAYAGSHIRRLGHTALGLRFVRHVDWLHDGTMADEIKGIRLRTIVNTFDRYPFPLKGKRNIFVMDTGQSLKSGNLYVRTLLRLEAVYRIGARMHVQPRAVLGAGDLNVPFSERFFVGGWAPALGGSALPGYAENELWGRNVMLTGVRLRYRLYRGVHVTAAAAAGYVNNDVDFIGNRLVFDWDQFRETFSDAVYAGAGCGLGMLTPLGPVELGYGIGDRASAGAGRAYLRLGYIF